MLSLAELERVLPVLDARIAGHRLREVVQPDAERVVLTSWGRRDGEGLRHHLLLSCARETARLSAVSRPPRALPTPPSFTQYLRAHALGARVVSASLRGGDRLAWLALATREGPAALLLQILGRRSNLYYLEADEPVVARKGIMLSS